jgi:hypothetical protein
LEAAGPGKTLPSKQELLDFQARWMRPAGISAVVGALVFAASLPIQPSGGGDNDAERLTNFHDSSTELIVGQGILIGLALLLFIPLLYVLVRSAKGRSARVRGWAVPLAFVGPVLFSISGVIVAVGLSDVASKFVDQAPAKEQQAREQAAAARAAPAKGGSEKGGSAKPATTATQPTTTAPSTTATAPTTTQSTTTAQSTTTTPRTPDQAASKARDDLASDLIDDSSALQVGSLVRFVGLVTLVFAMIYIPLWCMRTGLLTRFWAMLGVALGVALLLIPVGIFGLVLWFAVIGLMLAGVWTRPLPPAWAAGEAIPWAPPGEGAPPPEGGDPGTVEGSGREVSEQPLPENGAEAPPPAETQGQRRKKRKRRN